MFKMQYVVLVIIYMIIKVDIAKAKGLTNQRNKSIIVDIDDKDVDMVEVKVMTVMTLKTLGRKQNSVRNNVFADEYEVLVQTMGIFSKYSHKNCKLILQQNPDAKCVATYTEWQRLNRQVKAGEQAIYIWAPNDHGYGFHRVPVFDIEQTKAV